MHASRLVGLFVVCGALAVATGCSQQVQVRGTVKLDGQPLDNGSITFIPVDPTKGNTAGATISNGSYQIQGDNLPPPGAYRVEIRSQKKTGKMIPAGSPAPPGTMVEETVSAIPDKYNKASTLQSEFKTGSNTFDFDLTSDAK